MDFDLSPAEEQFRTQVRQFLDDNLGADVPRDRQFYQQWLANVRAKRWVGFSWPTEVGGGGASLLEQVILKEEMAKRNAPPLGTSFMGLAWVGPGIIQYGTEAQKKRFIPDILDSKGGAPRIARVDRMGSRQWFASVSGTDGGLGHRTRASL